MRTHTFLNRWEVDRHLENWEAALGAHLRGKVRSAHGAQSRNLVGPFVPAEFPNLTGFYSASPLGPAVTSLLQLAALETGEMQAPHRHFFQHRENRHHR